MLLLRKQALRTNVRAASATIALALVAACSTSAPGVNEEPTGEAHAAVSGVSGPTTVDTPIGLALEIDNGVGVPLRLRAGQTFYVNQLDVRAHLDAVTHDEGVAGLSESGDFATLPWGGVRLADEEPILLADAYGKFTRRRFYRDAAWMLLPSFFTIEQVDAEGRTIGAGDVVNSGLEHTRLPSDTFFVRRLRAIQWTYDCVSLHDCTGAKNFAEEALIELRNSMHEERTFKVLPGTKSLRVRWSLKPLSPWTVPVEQIASPTYDYGFKIDLVAVTPAGAGGIYAPGSDVQFRITLRDGSGKPLHEPGNLPTYNEVIWGPNEAGIQYYRAFFDPTTTYYRRKHRERMLMSQIIGPAQKIQAVRTPIELAAFLGPDDVQTVATPTRDGVFAQFTTIPTAHDLFGGAFDPTHAGWAAAVPDTFTYHIPTDAEPGTYLVTVKGRRTYLGQDIPYSKTVQLQVGTPTHTDPVLTTGGCNACHSGPSSLGTVNHANSNRAACAGCHAPLSFELEGPVYVRTHFLHSRSRRFDAPLSKCSSCHTTKESTQRTSKSACLSCHNSYPKSHVEKFGPIESMYFGGSTESFQQCSTSCHTSHPGSGL